jgi:hypothetical protein
MSFRKAFDLETYTTFNFDDVVADGRVVGDLKINELFTVPFERGVFLATQIGSKVATCVQFNENQPPEVRELSVNLFIQSRFPDGSSLTIYQP